MNKIYVIRQIILSSIAFIILILAFFENQLISKIVISPFLICSIALLLKNVFFLLNIEKLYSFFNFIFRSVFFVYVFGFLVFAIYYAILNKNYSLFIIVGIFSMAFIHFFKLSFLKRSKKRKKAKNN